jgi:hypothetical protein
VPTLFRGLSCPQPDRYSPESHAGHAMRDRGRAEEEWEIEAWRHKLLETFKRLIDNRSLFSNLCTPNFRIRYNILEDSLIKQPATSTSNIAKQKKRGGKKKKKTIHKKFEAIQSATYLNTRQHLHRNCCGNTQLGNLHTLQKFFYSSDLSQRNKFNE